MGPLRNYRLPDGTTRQYRDGEQPAGSVLVGKVVKHTPAVRAEMAASARAEAKAAAGEKKPTRRTRRKAPEKAE